jgi:uroporphyrin-III C-methyltransferase/precorrin-2 dehydrogenase/sirohydrochlorin ferrochelatase
MVETPTPYPLGLMLAGRRVLVVGGGTVATRRVPALLDAGAVVVVVAPHLTPALHALAADGRIQWHERGFQPSDVDGCWLVHVAVDDPAVAAAVSAAAEERRVFCVRADDRHAATAWTPATTRQGPVTVAVTAGGDPRRAMAIRDAIADLLTTGRLTGRAASSSDGGARPAPADEPDGDGRAPADQPDRAVSPLAAASDREPSSGQELSPHPEPSPDHAAPGGEPGSGPRPGSDGEPVAERMPRSRPGGRTAGRGRVVLVGAGPGDPDLITVRGRRVLAEADVVIADRLAPGLLLDELRPDVELVDASKIPHGPAAAQEEINRLLVTHARAGRLVVRLKGGDPYVFGRGGEEVLACAAAGIPVTVVPGVTSAIAVPAAAGIPVTHRGVAQEFVVVSGHLPPGHPESLVDWAALARLRGTLCILMGLTHLHAITKTLIGHGRSPDTPAVAVRAGTTPRQQTVRSDLATIAGAVARAGLRPPAVVVIGAVADITGQTDVPAWP